MKNTKCQALFTSALVAFLGVILTTPGLADGWRNPPEGPSIGRGGARLTWADDASTISHNPANLLDLDSSTINLTASAIVGYARKEYTSPFGMKEKTEDPWRFLPSLYGAYPLQDGNVVVGVGLHAPYSQKTNWKKDGILKGIAPYRSEVVGINLNPSVAARVGESLFIGAGASVMYTRLVLDQFFYLPPDVAATMSPGNPLLDMGFDADGYGYGVNAGVTWLLTEKQRLSLVYRSCVDVDLEGDFEPVGLPPDTFKTNIKFPSTAGLGYSIELPGDVRVEADLEWFEHSSTEELILNIGQYNDLLRAAFGSTSLPQNWEDQWVVSLGADWQLDDRWCLRGGWTYLPSPIPDTTVMPSFAENDQHILAVGTGYEARGHKVDLSYALGLVHEREVTEAMNPVFNGSYEFDSHLVALTYSCEL